MNLQPCGHPTSAIAGDGTTHWCSECEREAETMLPHIKYLTLVEEMILNRQAAFAESLVRRVVYRLVSLMERCGLKPWLAVSYRYARIEVYTGDPQQHWPEEVGYIRCTSDAMFEAVRKHIERSEG